MNTTDLHTLLVAPPVSRTTFFAQLLAGPSPHTPQEKPFEDLIPDCVAEPVITLGDAAGHAATGFPA